MALTQVADNFRRQSFELRALNFLSIGLFVKQKKSFPLTCDVIKCVICQRVEKSIKAILTHQVGELDYWCGIIGI